ncbi:hypothetical protein BSPCLSOX_2806 [uncultured Gammaproteobacteria bacterium]|nr:hypothetical protein BSPCLSOX_2806 [uncultured Gammaproteobacteria bacterium]
MYGVHHTLEQKIIKTLNTPCLMYALDAGGVTRKTPLIWGYAKKL